ncbi:hypothetical protein [Sinorhizobium alkalisoli]|uniref:Uncharacterized protein n=1 Tax=Sinorhizobium alkalisoli TaxID=1752398 RepID=A0A1E3V827_9HYPH|nr:hypothetical protein [Sinorhizobium alkalisoli]MCA1489449.1 hypothetical protein [Ensifer sp. NBAIM29]MCG5480518.1 hypothetical protein [Sinorhizobium alkalisoli]ODR89720.1 hypothetical protein A8M32_16105 [Sinorhizobium alkalisoli]
MVIPSRHIWKTVATIAGYRADLRKHNLHIGRTMRDLETHTEGKPNKRIQALLEELETAERKRQN